MAVMSQTTAIARDVRWLGQSQCPNFFVKFIRADVA